MYLIFREYLHARYAANNGAFLWCMLETVYECFCVALCLFLASASIMTEFKHEKTRATYLRLVLYSACTLIYWTPLAFIYFYLFSPSNYHIGRIIMKSTYHHTERSRIRRAPKQKYSKTRAVDEDDAESYIDDKVYAEAASTKEDRGRSLKQPAGGNAPVASPIAPNLQQVPAQTAVPPSFPPPIQPSSQPVPTGTSKYVQQASVPNQQGSAYYPPAHEMAAAGKQFAFGLPSPVTYADQQHQFQTQAVAPVFQTKDQADKNLAMHTHELVSQYQTLRDKLQKSQLQIQPRQPYDVMREDKERMLRPKSLKKLGKSDW